MSIFGSKGKRQVPLVKDGDHLVNMKTHEMRTDMFLSSAVLFIIVAIWLAVAFYSFYSTLNKYKLLKFNDLALVLPLASLFFTIIYAFPIFTNIARREFPVFLFFVVFCVAAHLPPLAAVFFITL